MMRHMDSEKMALHLHIDPMADVVFLLLVFFLFAFQFQSNGRLLKAETTEAPRKDTPTELQETGTSNPALIVHLSAGPDRRLESILVGGERFQSIRDLTALGGRVGTHSTVMLRADDSLEYRFVVEVTAVLVRMGYSVQLESNGGKPA